MTEKPNPIPLWVWRPHPPYQPHPADPKRCRASVYRSHSFLSGQCSRKAVEVRDGYGICKAHNRKLTEREAL